MDKVASRKVKKARQELEKARQYLQRSAVKFQKGRETPEQNPALTRRELTGPKTRRKEQRHGN